MKAGVFIVPLGVWNAPSRAVWSVVCRVKWVFFGAVVMGVVGKGFWGICKGGLGISDWVRSFYDIINLLLTFTPVTIFAITGSNKEVSLAK